MIVLTTAIACMTANLYFEARGEHVMGQYAVGHVTLNRAGHEKQKVCGVVLARKQFSWTTDRVRLRWGRAMIDEPTDPWAWDIARRIAGCVLQGKGMPDITHGSLFYHATYVHPAWRKSMVAQGTIQHHAFYSGPPISQHVHSHAIMLARLERP